MRLASALAKAAGVLAVGTATLTLASGAAFAGTNGQQLKFHDRIGNTYSINVIGFNQNGELVEHCFATPHTDNYLSGWWWKGTVEIYGSADGSCGFNGGEDTFLIHVGVPESQSGSDWTTFSD